MSQRASPPHAYVLTERSPESDAPETARRSRALHVQFLLFAMVGVGNALVDASMFTLLVAGFDWRDGFAPVAASVIGFLFGGLHSYLWNSRVTFLMGRDAHSLARVGQFVSVVTGGAIVSAVAFSAVRAVWPDGDTTLAASKLGAIGIAMIWNFSLMRGWVFSQRRLAAAESEA